jgi:hypothetical protein
MQWQAFRLLRRYGVVLFFCVVLCCAFIVGCRGELSDRGSHSKPPCPATILDYGRHTMDATLWDRRIQPNARIEAEAILCDS